MCHSAPAGDEWRATFNLRVKQHDPARNTTSVNRRRVPNDNPALESGYTELKVVVVSTSARGFEHKGVAALSGCKKARAINLNTLGLGWIRTTDKSMTLNIEIHKPDARTALDGQFYRRDPACRHCDRWWNGTLNGELSRRRWL